jgi:pyruvate dehydrogenase E1 component
MYKARDPWLVKARVRLLGAGTILNEVLAAAEMLDKEWGVASEVFSVTSFTELRRDGMEASRASRLQLPAAPCWIQTQLPKTGAPIIAASDYVSAVADLIRPWIADSYTALGTDGFGRSDTRAKLRKFFEVDRHAIVVAALHSIGDERVAKAMERYAIDPESRPPWTR